jgi:cytochrome c-type biogenesis protein CcmE
VEYQGVLPDLFREGQSVVVEGSLDPGGIMQAKQVLAKHDERYRPAK